MRGLRWKNEILGLRAGKLEQAGDVGNKGDHFKAEKGQYFRAKNFMVGVTRDLILPDEPK